MSLNVHRQAPAALVLGGFQNALGHLRALGRSGIEVYYIQKASTGQFVKRSRFCRTVEVPDVISQPRAAVEAVVQLARGLPRKPVLFQTEDVWMFAVGQYESMVLDCCLVPGSNWTTLQGILNKRTLYENAKALGVEVPLTIACQKLEDLELHFGTFPMPCIVKPQVTVRFLEHLPPELRKQCSHRTRRFRHKEELKCWCAAMRDAGLNVPVILQDFIPGGPDALYTLTSYSNRAGKMVAGSVGHKVRQMPPDAGCIVAGRLRHEPAVYEQGKRLLDGIEFHGLANTEFKFDLRDGRYKLMEINPRLGKWNSSALAAGLNLPLIAYSDLCGQTYSGPPISTKAEGALWLDIMEDALNCIYAYKARGYREHHLGLIGWLRSVRGQRIYANFAADDPLPALSLSWSMLFKLCACCLKKLRREF